MSQPNGRAISLSLPRRFVGDLLHTSRGIPLATDERVMALADILEARGHIVPRIGWCTLFTRAFGLVAHARPELRRTWIPWPWAHFYEHPYSVASVAVERQYKGEQAVFFTHLRDPEHQSLRAIENHLHRCKNEPIKSIALFRRTLYTSRLPLSARRLLWWFGTSFSGHRKARYLGTFGVSVTSGLGAAGLSLITPVTTGLNYGIFRGDGTLPVRLTYDQRVFDGGTAARILGDLESVLHQEIYGEMREMAGRRMAA